MQGDNRVAADGADLHMPALDRGGGSNWSPVLKGASAARQDGIIQPVRVSSIACGKEPVSVHRKVRNGNIGAALRRTEARYGLAVEFDELIPAVRDDKVIGIAYLQHLRFEVQRVCRVHDGVDEVPLTA